MKFYRYAELGPEGECYRTLSEGEILDEYWDHWYGLMIQQWGKERVDLEWGKEDCILDWVALNWAWEVSESGEAIAVIPIVGITATNNPPFDDGE
jgi:hypothetical protein